MKMISDLLITALFTVFIQNLVLNSGLGISEAIRVSTKPGTFGKIAGMISGFSVVTSVICSALNSASNFANLPFAGRAAVYGGGLAAVYLLVALLLKLIFRASDMLLGTLGIAALNTLVFAVPFINQSAAYSFADAIGSGIGGLPLICTNNEACNERGPRRISPFLIPGCIINMTSGQLAIMKNLKGPNIAHVTACSTGLHAIGEAMHIIARGDATVMVAGGCESTIHPVGVGGFDNMHALSRRNDDPKTASRPFDKDRDGFVMGEGAGVLVLEELEHARARGAHIYAEIVGYGLSGDAFHITTPSTDGPARCMRMALRHAGIAPEDIQYLNAHGTSTNVGDVNEVKAIKEVFGEHAGKLVVNSTKSMTGHLLGGAGGVESVFTIKALEEQVSPPTINVFEQDPECDIDCCPNEARRMEINYAMKNSFGFGGTNSTVIYKRWTE